MRKLITIGSIIMVTIAALGIYSGCADDNAQASANSAVNSQLIPIAENKILPEEFTSDQVSKESFKQKEVPPPEIQEAEYHAVYSEGQGGNIPYLELFSYRGDCVIQHKMNIPNDYWVGMRMVFERNGLFLGRAYGKDSSIYDFLFDTTNQKNLMVDLGHGYHYNPTILDNGLIAIGSKFSRKKLLNPDGTPSSVTLDFNYGIEMDTIMGVGGHGMEYRMDCVTYDTKNARYIAAFSRSTFFKSEDQQGTGPVGIAVFNAEGRQLDWFMLDGVETTQLGKQSGIGPYSDLFMLSNGNVLFSDPQGSGPVAEGKYDDMGINAEINLKTHEFETFENDEVEERYGETDNLCLSDAMFASARKKQPPCPLIVEYAPDGTHVYKRDKNKTLIQTLGKEYKLKIYAVDLDETCYLMFDKEDSKNS